MLSDVEVSSEGSALEASDSISSWRLDAIILHCAATFFAEVLNASALGDSASVIITGLPKSEPSIIPELSGTSPKNGILCFAGVLMLSFSLTKSDLDYIVSSFDKTCEIIKKALMSNNKIEDFLDISWIDSKLLKSGIFFKYFFKPSK